MNYVSISNLSVFYGTNEVLSQVDLSVRKNDFLGIIGPNGGGKTTLIKAIMGLVPYSGGIAFSDELIGNNDLKIGYLPQIAEFDTAFPVSVTDVAMSGLQAKTKFHYSSQECEKAISLMDKLGIQNVAKKPIGEISGGQMQRALLCRALISDPKLLILDEPANFVDNKFEKELYEILKGLNEHMAIIMVSHDIGAITTVVKSIVCVNKYVHRHDSNIISDEQLRHYNCPVEFITRG